VVSVAVFVAFLCVVTCAPIVYQVDSTLVEDTSVLIKLNATSPEGRTLSYAIVSGPFRGFVQGFSSLSGIFTYNPYKVCRSMLNRTLFNLFSGFLW